MSNPFLGSLNKRLKRGRAAVYMLKYFKFVELFDVIRMKGKIYKRNLEIIE